MIGPLQSGSGSAIILLVLLGSCCWKAARTDLAMAGGAACLYKLMLKEAMWGWMIRRYELYGIWYRYLSPHRGPQYLRRGMDDHGSTG